MQQPLTQYQSQYYAWLLTRRAAPRGRRLRGVAGINADRLAG